MSIVRIIGIGNRTAGDDAVGVFAARHARIAAGPGVDVIEAGMAGLAILDLMEGADQVFLIDAVRSGQPEGTILRMEIPRDLDRMKLLAWSAATCSTHAFGLADALTMGSALGLLPARLIVYGIELSHLTMGAPLSDRARQAARLVGERIRDELASLDRESPSAFR